MVPSACDLHPSPHASRPRLIGVLAQTVSATASTCFIHSIRRARRNLLLRNTLRVTRLRATTAGDRATTLCQGCEAAASRGDQRKHRRHDSWRPVTRHNVLRSPPVARIATFVVRFISGGRQALPKDKREALSHAFRSDRAQQKARSARTPRRRGAHDSKSEKIFEKNLRKRFRNAPRT
jgi:hypothetical protein